MAFRSFEIVGRVLQSRNISNRLAKCGAEISSTAGHACWHNITAVDLHKRVRSINVIAL